MSAGDETIKTGHIQWASVVRFARAAFVDRMRVASGLFGLAVGAFAWSSTGWLSGMLADRVLLLSESNRTLRGDPVLEAIVLGIVAALLIMYLGNRFGRLWINQSFIRALTRVHNQAIEAVLSTRMEFFNTMPTGRILSRFAGDFLNAGNSFDRVVATFLYSIFAMAFSTAYVLWTAPTLLLLAAPFCVVLFLVSRAFGARARDSQREASRANAHTLGHLSETFSSILTARALRIVPRVEDRLTALQRRATDLTYRTQQIANWRVYCQSILALGLVASALFHALVLVQRGDISVGEAGANVTLLMLILRNFLLVVELLNMLEVGFTSVERLNEFAELPPEDGSRAVHSRGTPAPLSVADDGAWPAIAFRDLSIRYAPHLPLVLDGINESVAPHAKVGLVGRTGAGKTTLVQALFRMVEVAPGQIFLQGRDICSLPLGTLRASFGVVPQDPVLFSGTVLDNVIGSPTDSGADAGRDRDRDPAGLHVRAERALRKVNLWDWVSGLPEGLASPVLERGANLSHGQRQLLCLARALAKEPKILILDEATSSVDPETEQRVDAAVHAATTGMTTLIIAHRLSTIEKCDVVWLMKDGRIIERGAPGELAARPDTHYSALRQAALRTGGVIA